MIKPIIAVGLLLLSSLANAETIVLGMGCFWGAEKRMAELPGVLDVESGYANGDVPGTYEAVIVHERRLKMGKASGRNHAEVIKVTFDPQAVGLEQVLARFWESHDPTQGDRQGNDIGSNYRSAVYTYDDAQRVIAQKTRDTYQAALKDAGRGAITSEIAPLQTYTRAEDYHQDYLKKNPSGYCGLGGTGVKYPGLVSAAKAPAPATPLDPKALDAQR
ncbi:peptide-methionine (S)-S-oxide reductase MsrA [Candidatus Thiodictyon syntrophicum]|jgi:peptide methionine sulfoxide reductase msrA/msrB|uniref:peptide-methionine (S)-S-oxide reductase MsrA n=1 Tax=Candidatus Thiodictyon syntrophicum TaxID=1166950 RepID=UPI001F02508A|nr:peptide-methionine (S)-S-oxide reductase MsrA [Candidatus Thiodictyon syntrophicum]